MATHGRACGASEHACCAVRVFCAAARQVQPCRSRARSLACTTQRCAARPAACCRLLRVCSFAEAAQRSFGAYGYDRVRQTNIGKPEVRRGTASRLHASCSRASRAGCLCAAARARARALANAGCLPRARAARGRNHARRARARISLLPLRSLRRLPCGQVSLKYFEEVFTSEHWMMRIYRVRDTPNREPPKRRARAARK